MRKEENKNPLNTAASAHKENNPCKNNFKQTVVVNAYYDHGDSLFVSVQILFPYTN